MNSTWNPDYELIILNSTKEKNKTFHPKNTDATIETFETAAKEDITSRKNTTLRTNLSIE